MATITRWWALTLIACSLLAGCGLTQTVTDGTVSITKSIFYRKIKTLHLDFTPRTAINADGAQTPLVTMVRVYQLRDRKAVDAADYQTLLCKADTVLKDDVLASKSLLMMPKGSVTTSTRTNPAQLCKHIRFSSTHFLRFPVFSAISRYSSGVRLFRDS